MASKSATEKFRAMLDKRGVEWWPMRGDEAGYREDRDTEFLVYGCKHVAHEWGCRLQVDMLTPEQAIAATLGSKPMSMRTFDSMETSLYDKYFSTPEKIAHYIKGNCVMDCYECSWPSTIPCDHKFWCDCSVEDLVEWLTETVIADD